MFCAVGDLLDLLNRMERMREEKGCAGIVILIAGVILVALGVYKLMSETHTESSLIKINDVWLEERGFGYVYYGTEVEATVEVDDAGFIVVMPPTIVRGETEYTYDHKQDMWISNRYPPKPEAVFSMEEYIPHSKGVYEDSQEMPDEGTEDNSLSEDSQDLLEDMPEDLDPAISQ